MSAVDAGAGGEAEAPPRRRRSLVPKFALAVPSWVWYVGFFVVPLLLIVVDSFGSKIQGTAGEVDRSSLTLERYREALNATFFDVMKQTLRTSITGTLLCLLIGFPAA